MHAFSFGVQTLESNVIEMVGYSSAEKENPLHSIILMELALFIGTLNREEKKFSLTPICIIINFLNLLMEMIQFKSKTWNGKCEILFKIKQPIAWQCTNSYIVCFVNGKKLSNLSWSTFIIRSQASTLAITMHCIRYVWLTPYVNTYGKNLITI